MRVIVCFLRNAVIARSGATKQSSLLFGLDCFRLRSLSYGGQVAALAMTPRVTSVQFLDRARDALPDADAHGGERTLAAARLHAVHRGQRQSRAAHAKRMPERDRAAMRIDEVGILLDSELAQT